MSDFDFIVDAIRFSYSSVTTFETCPYSFKLSYIDSLPRENNFYAEYGTLFHTCFEKFFKGEMEAFELSQYFADNYSRVIVSHEPYSPVGIGQKYKEQGQFFFDNFSFPKENYDVLIVEDKIDLDIEGERFVAKPDLVLRDKATGLNYLIDYKTSTPWRIDKRSGKEIADTKKLEGYKKQMYLYCHALRTKRNMPIKQVALWFPRARREYAFDWEQVEEDKVLFWANNMIRTIKSENIFAYNNKNTYFCENLCSVRKFCEYR